MELLIYNFAKKKKEEKSSQSKSTFLLLKIKRTPINKVRLTFSNKQLTVGVLFLAKNELSVSWNGLAGFVVSEARKHFSIHMRTQLFIRIGPRKTHVMPATIMQPGR